MRKYQVVNFAGILYGKPNEMEVGRLQYIERQLTKDNVWHPEHPDYVDVFKMLPLGRAHLRQLHSILSDISRKDPLATLHCEQVIGRVLRILNRPQNPSSDQVNEYHRNLQETLKLAEHLSRSDFNWRRLGRVLMAVAMCAAVASGIAFFFASAPVSFALAGSAVFLGAVSWYLNRYSPANLEEVVTDFVHNVKDFSNQHVDDMKPFSPCYIDPNDLFYQAHSIISTSMSGINNVSNKIRDALDQICYECTFSLKSRLIAGDSLREIQAQYNETKEYQGLDLLKRVMAISGLTAIKNQDSSIRVIGTTALYDLTHLDPLGSDNPEEALRQASEEYTVAIKRLDAPTYVQQVSETVSGWGRSIYSLFSRNTASRAVPSEDEQELLEYEEWRL